MAETSTHPAASPFDDGDMYDRLMGGLDYGVEFYVGLARQAGGPILDVCCGTGRILLPCLLAGADGDGLDLAPGMLATLRAKAAALNLAPRVVQADMRDFQMPRSYALIMITFNAFIHNLTQEAQLECLACCYRHLQPGGLLAFDTFFPNPEIVGVPEGTRVLEGELVEPQTNRLLRMYDTRTFNRVEQTQHSVYEIEASGPDGGTSLVHRSEFTTRYVYKQEMALLLKLAGFARHEICGDFTRRPLTQESDAMIVLAWRD